MSQLLRRLYTEGGQSPWLDNLQRSYLRDGVLQQLVNDGVRGLTSNPTIFQKAIEGSSDYDSQFRQLMSQGLSVEEAYWEMVLADISSALDVFQPLYLESNGEDGYVSVEVDPRLAQNSESTLLAARNLHERIKRPNVMIKIPATREGLPAIRQMIAEGRSVNVTLIFSLDRYREVAEAYIAGLEERVSQGLTIDGVRSVASFFISRVDNEIDNALSQQDSSFAHQLRGRSAINQARLAYRIFNETFSSSRWEVLASNGAAPQRLLWASTSTKNPAYPDTLYVDQLIGPFTVNTLPDATLAAFADHGVIGRTIDADMAVAEEQWNSLSSHGVDVDAVAKKLEKDGVESFISSFESLLTTLTIKAKTF